jgi:hypothetical protein
MRAYIYTAQSIPANTNTVVKFDAVSFDTNSNYNSSTGTYTAPIAGYYHIYANVGFSAVSATGYTYAQVYVNGTFVQRGPFAYVSTSGEAVQVGVELIGYLSAGNTVTIEVSVAAAESTRTGNGYSTFEIFLVST